jgi:hypothetical protein
VVFSLDTGFFNVFVCLADCGVLSCFYGFPILLGRLFCLRGDGKTKEVCNEKKLQDMLFCGFLWFSVSEWFRSKELGGELGLLCSLSLQTGENDVYSV